jgi:uncharacterized protein
MEVKGTYTFDASTATVWDLLMDPVVVAGCLPGCEGLVPAGDDRYEATLTMGVAAITGTYRGTVTIADKQPPNAYRLLVEGQGRPGFVKGASAVSLREENGRTVVEVAGQVEVGGAIARVGQRLLGSVSKMMLDRFFACLQHKAAPGV